jgi:hypothetical protein
MLDKGQKSSEYECYTLSSEPFRSHKVNSVVRLCSDISSTLDNRLIDGSKDIIRYHTRNRMQTPQIKAVTMSTLRTSRTLLPRKIFVYVSSTRFS